jgi:Icc-related predicted phosphoesterase
MADFLFASDLHGHLERYEKLFQAIESRKPGAVFLGGDLLPVGSQAGGHIRSTSQFFTNMFLSGFQRLKQALGKAYPAIFLILGNDDPKLSESLFADASHAGLWNYMHNRRVPLGQYWVYGYACIPPSPFLLKDWERYDVSRHVDPGCISPEEGWRTVPEAANQVRHGTIREDLDQLFRQDDLSRAILLLHTPPYRTKLDRAALDGRVVDHVPVDVHVGSIAVRQLIEQRQPLLTLHGHIHESARMTGSWLDRIGQTYMYSAAHDGPELALVWFDLKNPGAAERQLV